MIFVDYKMRSEDHGLLRVLNFDLETIAFSNSVLESYINEDVTTIRLLDMLRDKLV
jgi:hypothetical protein